MVLSGEEKGATVRGVLLANLGHLSAVAQAHNGARLNALQQGAGLLGIEQMNVA